jgi:CheY-like chemotaxis protein
MTDTKTSVPIFLVEDDETDIEAVRRALKRANILNPFHVAFDGVEALNILRGQNGKEKLKQPCLILADINMPCMSGLEFLQELRSDVTLKRNVVFMLTTSGNSEDKDKAYQMNIAGYILKENLTMLAEMLDYYCRINKFPSQ